MVDVIAKAPLSAALHQRVKYCPVKQDKVPNSRSNVAAHAVQVNRVSPGNPTKILYACCCRNTINAACTKHRGHKQCPQIVDIHTR